jgi:cytochrome b561
MFSGYLISTADGRAVDVFDWFSIPATIHGYDNQEDIAGLVHLVLAISLISLVTLHAAAALKHHFIDRDRTLLRMSGK